MSRNWAICIGINEYYNLTPLRYAVQDATAMRDFFLEEIEFEQVFYFADDSPPIDTPQGSMRSQPTYANLTYFFRKRFQKQFLTVGDNFWFFFAGHGELHEGHDYLMPIDVDPGNLERTALRISDITASLRNSGADNTVLLLDACRSQGKRAAVGFGSDAQPGIVTIYACSPRQASYEIEALQHGSFTHALLEGLRLLGAESCATVQRIDQYLRHQVPILNQRYQKPVQTPYTAVEPLSKNCLILLPQRARLEDVQALKNAAYKAEIEDDWELAQQLWTRVLATPGVDQDAVLAIGRIAVKRAQPSPAAAPPQTAGSRRIEASVARPARPVVPTLGFDVVTISDIERGLQGSGQPKVIINSRRLRAEYRREDLGGGVTLDLMRLPSGTFIMGSPATEAGRDVYKVWENLAGIDVEGPQHRVEVAAFWMGKYAVTQVHWCAVAALPKIERDLNHDPAEFKGDERPVEQVSWDDATEFCRRLSKHSGRTYRLPREAEWEYACRAGTTTPFHFGSTITPELSNYAAVDYEYEGYKFSASYGEGPKGAYRKQTTDVGSFPANAFGLYDMHGNVWEWCEDHWHNSYKGAPIDGSSWKSSDIDAYRLRRGGSWNINPVNCRSAYRGRNPCGIRGNGIGFRVVCASAWTLA
ncbi:MAG: SUMF1/EgtB/PvdO family nonheme iron enzyme [Cyanobacteria bacterium P01_D01_bin.1]